MALATFVRFKVKIPGVSVELTSSDENQFTDKLTSADTQLFGYYLMNLFEMQNYSGAYTTRERGMFGLHFVNSTSGALDTTWITADFSAVESAVQTYWSSHLTYFPNQVRLVEHRWYPFGPGYKGTKSAPIPPARVTTLGTPIQGSNASGWVHQVATNITLRTTLRRHWGRTCVPHSSALYSTSGQLASSDVDSIAGWAKTMLTTAEASQGVSPVVYDKVREQVYGVTAIEVDSVPDIQRRRRPRDPGYKKVLTS